MAEEGCDEGTRLAGPVSEEYGWEEGQMRVDTGLASRLSWLGAGLEPQSG
jgi:hypothetical protein